MDAYCLWTIRNNQRRTGTRARRPGRRISTESKELMKRGTRILLVEDDRSIAGFVEPELEHLGFHVRCAHDGVAGLEEAETFSPALVILDIMLPRLDGV